MIVRWGDLREGDLLFAKRSQSVYLVLTPEKDPAYPGEVSLFDLYNGRRVTSHQPDYEVNPWHYEFVKRQATAEGR